MRTDTLIEVYPVLYHMADPRNFASILERGLLSTSALLDLLEIDGEPRHAIESQHRAQTIPIENDAYGSAYIRDQRPMSVGGLARSLADATPQQFFEFLNGRMFFWLTPERLANMNSAAAYHGLEQVVFVLQTEAIVRAYEHSILLSPMNSGATRPVAHPRSIAMFKPIETFDWEMRRPRRNRVVELTIAESIPDFMQYISGIEVWRDGNRLRTIVQPYSPEEFS